MFKRNFRFCIEKSSFFKCILIGSSLSALSLANSAFSQSQNSSSQELKQAMVSHILSRVRITRSNNPDENLRVKEGDFLTIGNIVRTGEDSVVRILFPDGTTETLCENTTYQVQESGSEIYEEGDDANRRENIISALTRCNIRPRFIERCRSDNGSILRNTKAGEKGKLGGLGQPQTPRNQPRNEQSAVEFEKNSTRTEDRFLDLDNSNRCTTGEQLFTNYVFIPQPIESQPTIKPTTASVPAPPETLITVPESGGSPVN